MCIYLFFFFLKVNYSESGHSKKPSVLRPGSCLTQEGPPEGTMHFVGTRSSLLGDGADRMRWSFLREHPVKYLL